MSRYARPVVVPPPPLRQVRPRWLLRFVTEPARQQARSRDRASRRAELRTGRGLVLGLLRGRLRRLRARPGAAPLAPGESDSPRTPRTRTARLAGPPELTLARQSL